MLDIQQPISHYAIAAYAQQERSSMQEQAILLTEHIKRSLAANQLESTIEGAISAMYRFRIELFQLENQVLKRDLQSFIVNEIAKAYQNPIHKMLNKTIGEAWAIYLDIYTAVLECHSIEKLNTGAAKLPKDYAVLQAAFQYIPASFNQFNLKFLEASLQFETALLIADFINMGNIKSPSTALVEELRLYIKKVIGRYGAYAITLGLWMPDDKDFKLPLVNNMRILAAKINIESGHRSQQTSLDELKKMIFN